MEGLENLKSAAALLQSVGDDIARIDTVRDGDWRHQLVKARRRMVEAVAQTANALSLAGRAPHSSRAEFAQLREELNAFRSALALHQATFPVSALDRSEGYEQSSRDLQARLGRATQLVARFVVEG